MASPDGHCRTFDAKAQGTVGGSGVGIVVLKRLADALEDGDTVLAVIKGSAINNDGALKVGFTAPSLEGQAEVITDAMTMADIDVESISYIEAHGTATMLGDPIEMGALTHAYQALIERIGRHNNFFDLGGHSLLAIQLISRMRDALEMDDLPLSSLFESPTVAELAEIAAASEDEATAEELEALLMEIEGLTEEELEAALLAEMDL